MKIVDFGYFNIPISMPWIFLLNALSCSWDIVDTPFESLHAPSVSWFQLYITLNSCNSSRSSISSSSGSSIRISSNSSSSNSRDTVPLG